MLSLTKKKLILKIILLSFLFIPQVYANKVNNWIKIEIDTILNAYKNQNISNEERFDLIEETINKNFAGAGIAKFVAGQAWATSDKSTKGEYIKLFKRHLALNIASMIRGYSNQTYSIIDTKIDTTNNVILIDMEIQDQTNKTLVTWRVKEAKNRFYVIDLLLADISLVVTKRSEFNSMLKKVNYDLKVFNETLKNQNDSSYKLFIQ